MNKFLKAGLGFVAMAGLVSGSLFAFNISTSIDNALQVIKTIWVTSDGTTNNPPFVTMDGSGKYVSIGTIDTANTLTVSGSVLAQYNQAAISLSTGFYSGINFYPIPTASLIINDPYATGLTTVTGISAQVSVYDTRAINPSDPQVGATMATYSPGLFDQNQRAEISVQNATEVSLDAQSGSVHTSLDLESDRLQIYSSGGASSMYFDGILGLFGFGTNSPQNTIDIGGGYVPGTLGLRFSGRTGNAGQVLGLNNAGDVVLLGTLGGGSSYWTQNGNDMYPTTLGNNVGIGTNTPSETLSLSGTALMENSNRGWEFVNDALVPGINRIGGRFNSGAQYVQNTITDIYNGLPVANMGWFDTNTNEESNFSAFQQSATMHYNSDRTSANSGLRNGIDITPNDVEIKYDQNNISGAYIELNLGPLGFGVSNGMTFTHMFTNSGYVGINNINPSHTLSVSGTFIANDGAQGLAVSPNLLGMGMPGAMSTYTSGTQLGFMFAGNPGVNPVFDAGAGAFLGFIDMVGFNDRAILSVKSGSIEFGVDQGGIDEIEFDFNTEYWSVESNSGFDNLWMDFNTNFLGINTASPQKALHVSGAIVSSAMFINGPFDGVIDVQNVNSIFVDTTSGPVDLRGLSNGTVGQIITIVKTNNGGSNFTAYELWNATNSDIALGFASFLWAAKRASFFIYDGSVRYKN